MSHGSQIWRISGRQLAVLVVLNRLFSATTLMPLITSDHMGRDAWISGIISVVAVLPLALLVAKLGSMHPGETLAQYAVKVLGRPLGGALILLYVWFFLALAATAGRTVSETYAVAFLPFTPVVVLVTVTVFLGCLAARQGLEVVARGAEGIALPVMAVFVLILALSSDQLRLERLQPILENGVGRVVTAATGSFALFGEVIAVAMIIPFVRPAKAVRGSLLWGLALGGGLLVPSMIWIVGVLGPTADSQVNPLLALARMVRLANFLERIELLPLVIWTLMAWLKIGTYIWLAAIGLTQLFNLDDYRPLIYPLGFAVSGLSLVLYRSTADIVRFFSADTFGVFATVFEVGTIGLLLLATLAWRGVARLKPGNQGGEAKVNE
jgi:spore germination protein KB